MLQTYWATVHQGKIELLEPTRLPEGTRVLVTLIFEDESKSNAMKEKAKFIQSLKGKYAYLETSSTKFAERKQTEIEWENRSH